MVLYSLGFASSCIVYVQVQEDLAGTPGGGTRRGLLGGQASVGKGRGFDG